MNKESDLQIASKPIRQALEKLGLVFGVATGLPWAWGVVTGSSPEMPIVLYYVCWGILSSSIAWVTIPFFVSAKIVDLESESILYKDAPQELHHLSRAISRFKEVVSLICVTSIVILCTALVFAVAWNFDQQLMMFTSAVALWLLSVPVVHSLSIGKKTLQRDGRQLEKSIRFKLSEWPYAGRPYTSGPFTDQSHEVISGHELIKTSDLKRHLLQNKIDRLVAPSEQVLYAAFHDDIQGLMDLSASNGDDILNIQDVDGWSSLHFAIAKQNSDIVQFLAPNSNLNIVDNWGMTPLILASYLAIPTDWSIPLVNYSKLLLKLGANVDEQDELGRTALHHAAFSQNFDMIALLIGSGANVEIQNCVGETPLARLYSRGPQNMQSYLQSLELFLDKGCDPWTRTNGNYTELFSISSFNRWEILDLFEAKGIRLNSHPHDACNPINHLFYNKKWKAITRLRERGLPFPDDFQIWKKIRYYWEHSRHRADSTTAVSRSAQPPDE